MVILIVLLIVLIVTQLVTHQILKRQHFGRGAYPDFANAAYFYDDYKDRYAREGVSFLSGKNRLQGYVYGTENDKGLIVISHGIGGGHENYINTIVWFLDRGWQVFAYDGTGSCESEGDGTVGLVQSALDLDAALSFIENESRFAGLPVLLFGHSWGGYAVSAGLTFDHRVAASAALAAYSSPSDILFEKARDVMGGAGILLSPFLWFDQILTFGRHASLSAVDSINSTAIPVLIVHGSEDEMIAVDGAALIAKKTRITNPNVEYLILDAPGQNSHNSIFRSPEAVPYIDDVNARFQTLFDQHKGQIPDEVRQAFMSGVDKALVNRVNESLLLQIEKFYERALTDVSLESKR